MDTIAPSLDIITPANGSYNNTGSVTIRWTGDEPADFDHYEIGLNGGAWTSVSGRNVSLSGLSDAAYTVLVRAYDRAGNFNQDSVTFIVDRIAPSVQIFSPNNSSYNNTGSVTIRWTGDEPTDFDHYEIRIKDGAWTTVGGKVKTYNGLNDGTYDVGVRAYDRAGNLNQDSVTFIVDRIAPALSITAPANGTYTNSTSITVTWSMNNVTGIAQIQVRTDGGAWSNVPVSNHSTVLRGLGNREHVVDVKATDLAGNTASRSVRFTVDSVSPTILSRSPTGENVLLNSSISITFSKPMNMTSAVVKVNGEKRTIAWNGNKASIAMTLSYGGVYNVTVTAWDLVGNDVFARWTFATLKDQGGLSGTVLGDGRPISNATVMLGNGTWTVTDSEGRFNLSNVTSGWYTLTVHKEGYEDLTFEATVEPGVISELGSQVLTASPHEGGISGSDIEWIFLASMALAAAIGVAHVWRKPKTPSP